MAGVKAFHLEDITQGWIVSVVNYQGVKRTGLKGVGVRCLWGETNLVTKNVQIESRRTFSNLQVKRKKRTRWEDDFLSKF